MRSKIYVVLEKVDMRKSINGLSMMISSKYEKNPGTGERYVFSNGRDKIKVLHFDKNGFVLYYKRFERRVAKIAIDKGGTLVINSVELRALLAGLGIEKLLILQKENYEIY